MRVPDYYRSEKFLYVLRSAPYFGYWTGTLRNGQQLLLSTQTIFFDTTNGWRIPNELPGACGVFFDGAGNVLSAEEGVRYEIPPAWFPKPVFTGKTSLGPASWIATLGFVDRAIQIKRFAVPSLNLMIADLPVGLFSPDDDPDLDEEEQFSLSAAVRSWIDSGNFAFHCGCGSCSVAANGAAISYDGE
jgi:hypothetical protein